MGTVVKTTHGNRPAISQWTLYAAFRSTTLLLLLRPVKALGGSAMADSALRYHAEENHDSMESMKWKTTRDLNYCLVDHSNCYNTGQCCPGFICSTRSNDVRYKDPDDLPGVCVKAAEPYKCTSDEQCHSGQQCVTAGSLKYCQTNLSPTSLQHSEANQQQQQQHEFYHDDENEKMHHKYQQQHQIYHTGGLGSPCENTTQCLPFTSDGLDRLCCQDVKRGRQGTKRMCDRITQLSLCINALAKR